MSSMLQEGGGGVYRVLGRQLFNPNERWGRTSVQLSSIFFLKLVTEGSVTMETGSLLQHFTTPPKIPNFYFGGGSNLNQLSLKSKRFLTHATSGAQAKFQPR